jgi:hypothetical protein
MVMILFDKIKDEWLTWRTGCDKSTREWRTWIQQNIVSNASDVTNYFQGFKYVIAVDYHKVNSKFDPLYGKIESYEFLSYMWPNRSLGQHCMYKIFRGGWNPYDNRFHLTEFGFDQMFVATNSEEDAIMIKLKWS